MANEKEQGRQNAEFNIETTYLLMRSGAIEDAGVLLENYLEMHPMDAEVAPVVLAYVLHTVEVTRFLKGEDYQPGKIHIEKAKEKRELLFGALDVLREDQRDAFYKTYLPEVLCALFWEKDTSGDEMYSFLSLFSQIAKEIALPAFLSYSESVARVFLPCFENEEIYQFTMSVMDAVYRMDTALYGKVALAFGRVATELGDFSVAKAMLENASPFLESLAECRFLELCVALGARSEKEFLSAEGFSKQMPEYMNLLVAIAGDDALTKHYTELAEKNLSGEYKKKTQSKSEKIGFKDLPKPIKLTAIISAVVTFVISIALLFPNMCSGSATYKSYKKYADGWGLSFLPTEEDIVDGVYRIPEKIKGDPVISLERYTLTSDSLVIVYIPKTVKKIDDGTFAGAIHLQLIIVDEENPYFKSIDGVLYSKDGKQLIAYPAAKSDTSFNVPDGVEYIRPCSFDGANKLKELTLPESVMAVGDYAFDSTYSLKIYFYNENIDWHMNWNYGAQNMEVVPAYDSSNNANDESNEGQFGALEFPTNPT